MEKSLINLIDNWATKLTKHWDAQGNPCWLSDDQLCLISLKSGLISIVPSYGYEHLFKPEDFGTAMSEFEKLHLQAIEHYDMIRSVCDEMGCVTGEPPKPSLFKRE